MIRKIEDVEVLYTMDCGHRLSQSVNHPEFAKITHSTFTIWQPGVEMLCPLCIAQHDFTLKQEKHHRETAPESGGIHHRETTLCNPANDYLVLLRLIQQAVALQWHLIGPTPNPHFEGEWKRLTARLQELINSCL